MPKHRLWWLADHGGAPTQAELAAQAGTDPMMTSQVVRRLEARGLVRRHADPADSRARRLELTAAGAEALAPALADVEAADADYFGALDPHDVRALVGSLQLLAGHLSDR